jgi:hypothetical protein
MILGLMRSLLTPLVALAALLLPIGQASAESVIGTGGGTFASLSSCDNSGTSKNCKIVSSSYGAATQVQWGSQSTHTNFVNPSTLTSVNVSFDTTTPAVIEIGRLDWYNSATLRLDSSLDLFKVDWSLSVNFTSPSGPDPNGYELFHFSITNPVNPPGDTIFGFQLADLSGLASSITLDGVTLSNFRYSVIDGAGSGNSWLGSNWWYNDEYNYASLSILADVSAVTAPIPEPETYAMLLAGLGFLGWAHRRRKASL